MTTDRSPRRAGAPRAAVTAALLAALVGSLTAAPAQAVSADPDLFCDLPGQNLAIAPISGLEDGDAVTWLSTVKGTTPTTFTGEYVGKLENGLGYDADGDPRDLLLVRLDGDIVNGTAGSLAAGVWAGASGSPVYDADGALIGAVSYGFSGLADNVAGVTPAAYMKTIGQLPGTRALSPAAQKQVAKMLGEAPPSASAAPAKMRQLQPVRVTSGTTAARIDGASARLAERVDGFRPAGSKGLAIDGGANDGVDYPIVAGGNIAVSYAYGAIGEASVGTVTAVCGDEVFAYGHPNNWNSSLGASIHGASAARIVPDLLGSYKLVSAIGKVKGTLVDDRLAGVRGTLGAGAATIPITTVSTIGGHRTAAVTHVSEDMLVAPAAAAQLASDATRVLDNQWEGSAKVGWSITYERRNGSIHTLKNVNRYANADFFSDLVGEELAENIAMLQLNPFEDVTIVQVRVSAKFAEGNRVGRLSGVQIRQNGAWKTLAQGSTTKVKRGATYSFRTVLGAAPGGTRVTEYRPFTVTVPSSLKKTMKVTLGVPAPGRDPMFARSFGTFVAALDDNTRFDVIDRTRTYVSTSGQRRTVTTPMAAPTVVLDEGRSLSFLLEAPAK
jgi:hypothetical protein